MKKDEFVDVVSQIILVGDAEDRTYEESAISIWNWLKQKDKK